ncbi:MAG: hypothetical protein Q7S95_02140 [bacterium]|nr:hypothetical protein [bacterium]
MVETVEEAGMPCKPCVRVNEEGIVCGHSVGNGGDRHALNHCPARHKPGENRRGRKHAGRRVAERALREAAKVQAIAEARAAVRHAAADKEASSQGHRGH